MEVLLLLADNITNFKILKVCAPFKSDHSGGCFHSNGSLDVLDFIGPQDSLTPLSAVGFSAALSQVTCISSVKM